MQGKSSFAPAGRLGLVLAFVLVLLALARPIDHDESQYVAAAVLARDGLPYRDFAYLQTPLQPLLFAPLADLFGIYAYPGLRIVNALLGATAVAASFAAMRALAVPERTALGCAGLLAACDIFLFSSATARNDALPAALYACALWAMVWRREGALGRGRAALIGLLLAAAAAAKISYAVPALAFGGCALINRNRRPAWIVAGAVPVAALVGWLAWTSPEGFWFGVFDFPARAPANHYRAHEAGYKLSFWAKGLDTLKFLALGPALLALVLVARDRRGSRSTRMLDLLIVAGLIAALLPAPTWRQYLLPVLPPLFVRLATIWAARPPDRSFVWIAAAFALAGIAPSAVGAARAVRGGVPMIEAMRHGAAIGRVLDGLGVAGPVATLSPQFLPAARRRPDPRFATGPFQYRSRGLLSPEGEARVGVVSAPNLELARPAPRVVLVGGEGQWTGGRDSLDRLLERYAIEAGGRVAHVEGGRFRIYLMP